MTSIPIPVLTIGLLLASNIFLTFAWCGHLDYKSAPLITVTLISWGIKFFEFALQVPANRIGKGLSSAAELMMTPEVITLVVLAAFSVPYLREPLAWNHLAGFALIASGAAPVFKPWA